MEQRKNKTVKKILITTDLYLPSVNGVVTSILNLVGELEKDAYEVRILTTSYDRNYHHEGNVYYMRSIPCQVYPGVRIPLQYLKHPYMDELIAWKPDIVHSQCVFFSFQYASKIARAVRCPLVHTYHTLYGQYASYLPVHVGSDKIIAVASQLRLEGVHMVIAPTEKVKGVLREYGVKVPISVVPTGISLEKFRQPVSSEERDALRASLGISRDCKVLVSIGRLGKEKNIGELIRYYKNLTERRTDTRFVIVGGGPAMEQLKELAASLDLNESHVIFTGMVKPDVVRQYYAIGDAFVCASTSETQGLTYVEAMASGLPLVCRRDAALTGVVEDGTNGYQYEDSREFCSYLSKIFDSPLLAARMCEKSRERAELFSKEQFAKNIEALYQSV